MTIPIVLKTVGWNSGQTAVAVVSRLAAIISVAAIRYCEEIGLIRPVARQGGQRIYDHADAHRLAFIRRCRDFDFSIDDIRSLLSPMQTGGSCSGARELAEGHLVDLRGKLAELTALERTIASLVAAALRLATAVRPPTA